MPLEGPGATDLLDQLMESVTASETALLDVAQAMAGQAITPEHTTKWTGSKLPSRSAD